MFDVFSKLIHKQENQLIATTGHYVTDPDEIDHLLSQAKITRTLLTVTFPEHEHHFTTAVLGVYEEYDFMVIDELTPVRGNDLLVEQEQSKVQLNGLMKGVELRFETSLIEARSQNGVAFYKMMIPERVYYQQRRFDHRVPPRTSGTPFQGFRGKQEQQLLKGYLFDLSRNGVGIILKGIQTLRRGEVLSGCTLPISDNQTITFSLEVRFVSQNKRRAVTRLGGRFKKMDKQAMGDIRRAVNRMEREEAKRLNELK